MHVAGNYLIQIIERGRPEFAKRAACRGMPSDWFFPGTKQTTSEELGNAQQVCNNCPVQFDCLTYAMENKEEYGWWGGSSQKQREKALERGTSPSDLFAKIRRDYKLQQG